MSMVSAQDVMAELEKQASAIQQFIEKHNERSKGMEAKLNALDSDFTADSKRLADLTMKHELRMPGTAGNPLTASGPQMWRDTKSGLRVPVLGPSHRLADFTTGESKNVPSVGRFLRGVVLGGRADDARELAEERKALSIDSDPSGGYVVDGMLAAQWIDLLRAKLVLSQAGVSTVPMESKSLTLAKLTGDVTASWHVENAALADSDPSFGAITLDSRTVVALVRLSLELAQDSANIDEILQASLTNALASAIDAAGLQGSSPDGAAAPQGILNYSGINSVSGVGTPADWGFLLDAVAALMADNVPLASIGALIGPVSLWKSLAKAKTGIADDNSPLPEPPAIARIPRLWTTALPSTTAVIGDWRSYLFGIRQQIQVRILDQAFMGSNLQLAVLAYARCDFQPTREADFCSLEGLTV